MSLSIPNLPCQVHASCVAFKARGLLIVGRSGAGKSALALQLMAIGAELVADDRCDLLDGQTGPIASRPFSLPEAIEARGLGVLATSCARPAQVCAVMDLDAATESRLPPPTTVRIGKYDIPRFERVDAPHLPSALLLFLKHGFHASMEQ